MFRQANITNTVSLVTLRNKFFSAEKHIENNSLATNLPTGRQGREVIKF